MAPSVTAELTNSEAESERNKRKMTEAEYAMRRQELTFDSAAGLTFPFTEYAPPSTPTCPIFFGNEGSSSRAWEMNRNSDCQIGRSI